MYRVLAALAEQGGPQRLGELALLTSIETSTLSRLATEMQRRGYLTPRPAGSRSAQPSGGADHRGGEACRPADAPRGAL